MNVQLKPIRKDEQFN